MKPGQRVRAPDPHGEDEVEATFVAPVDPDEIPPGERDRGWVRYEDGTTASWPYERIRVLD